MNFCVCATVYCIGREALLLFLPIHEERDYKREKEKIRYLQNMVKYVQWINIIIVWQLLLTSLRLINWLCLANTVGLLFLRSLFWALIKHVCLVLLLLLTYESMVIRFPFTSWSPLINFTYIVTFWFIFRKKENLNLFYVTNKTVLTHHNLYKESTNYDKNFTLGEKMSLKLWGYIFPTRTLIGKWLILC